LIKPNIVNDVIAIEGLHYYFTHTVITFICTIISYRIFQQADWNDPHTTIIYPKINSLIKHY